MNNNTLKQDLLRQVFSFFKNSHFFFFFLINIYLFIVLDETNLRSTTLIKSSNWIDTSILSTRSVFVFFDKSVNLLFPVNFYISYTVLFSFLYTLGISLSLFLIKKYFKKKNTILFALCTSLVYFYNFFILDKYLLGYFDFLIAHSLSFPIALYSIFDFEKKNSWDVCILILIFIAGFFSTYHQPIFLIIFLFSLIQNNIVNKKNLIRIGIYFLGFTLLGVVNLVRLSGQTEEEQILPNLSSKYDIISAFNPDIELNNFFLKSILGFNNWSIRDILNIELYNLPEQTFLIAGLLFIFFISGILINFLLEQRNCKEKKAFAILIVSIICLIISFGISNFITEKLNYFFYKIPFSFLYKESSKLYSFFLLFFTLFSLTKISKVKVIRRFLFSVSTLSLIVIFIVFVIAKNNIDYLQNTETVFEINKICKDKQVLKTLFLPQDIFIHDNNFAKGYIQNPRDTILKCDFYVATKSTTNHTQTKNLTLNYSKEAKKIDDLFNPKVMSEVILKEELRKLGINLVIIDISDNETKNINLQLEQYNIKKVFQSKNLIIYQF